jgi:hypothetical protein
MIYGGLLLGLASASWYQWTAAPTVELDGGVVLLSGEGDEIEEIRWTSPDNEATITRKSDANGGYFWVEYTRYTDAPAAPIPSEGGEDTGSDSEESADPERIATRSVFKAADKAERLVESLSPMVALRQLDVSDEDKLAELGLDAPTSGIEIIRDGRTQRVEVGAEAYGTRHRFVRLPETGAVYLVERDLIQPLRYARTRLPDRTLFGTDSATLTGATLSAGGGKLQMTQRNGENAAKAGWSRNDAPDVTAEQLTTWMHKALKLKGTRFADPDDPPTDLQPRFTLALIDDQGRTERLKVSQVGPEGDWYGQSEHTRGLVKLVRSSARSLADDVQAVIEGE